MPSSLPSTLPDVVSRAPAADAEYRPLVLRVAEPAQEAQRRQLVAEAGVRVLDTYATQLDGLLRSRNPRRRLTPAELEVARHEHLGGRSLDAAGVWVYYPWQKCMVHLLDESEFVELRTSRNQHKVTREEQRFLSQRRVGIVGLSVGAHVAMVLG